MAGKGKGKKKRPDKKEQQTRQTTGQPPSGGASANPVPSTSSCQGNVQTILSSDLEKIQIATSTTPSLVEAIPGPRPKQVLGQDVLENWIWNKSGKGSFQNPYKDVNERKKHRGTAGRKVKIKTNHFSVDLKERNIFRYDVDFKMPWKREIRKKDEPILIRAIEAMKAIKKFPKFCSVFDGRKTLLSSKDLKISPVLNVSVRVADEEDSKKMLDIDISVKPIGLPMSLKEIITRFEEKGGQADFQPLDAIQTLNIILNYSLKLDPKMVVLGPKYFDPDKDKSVIEPAAGMFVWHGCYESVRVGWKIRLNIDMANKPAYEEQKLEDFIGNYLHSKDFNCSNMVTMASELETRRAAKDMSDRHIRDLKVRFERPDGAKRDYRMNRLGKNANQQTFLLENKSKVSIAQYFKDTYNYKIKYPKLPVVHVGDKKKSNYLPIELLKLKRQACPLSKVLGEVATSEMIKVTAVRPDKRQAFIRDKLQERQKDFRNGHAEAFGISVADNFETIDGRILNPPSLAYGGTSVIPSNKIDGKWRADRMKFVSSKDLKRWAILDLANTYPDALTTFAKAIAKEAQLMGMGSEEPLQRKLGRNELQLDEKIFKEICDKKPSIIVVIIENKSSDARPRLKHIGDSIKMVPTSFVIKKNVSFRNGPPSPATIHNIVLKLNSKLGGKNQMLSAPSNVDVGIANRDQGGRVFQKPIMFVGADVTHPAPDQMGLKPSIAAVVASYDPAVSLYNVEVNVQYSKQDNKNVVEQIMNLETMMKSLLIKFKEKTRGHEPERIVFYRDGVSEGQFQMVVNKEIAAIQRACKKLNDKFQPGITYFVAQKRHRTRFYPSDDKNKLRNGNILPGTIIDTDITHPTVSSFYLASHEGIQGTTKPTYYVKLYDDNNLSADVEQALTYYLCHLYARCERSVSYPAPTYYAHLAAFRAREHHNALLSKYVSADKIPKEELDKIQRLNLVNYFV